MVALAPITNENLAWDVLDRFPKMHSRAREAKTSNCTEARHSKSLGRVEIWLMIYESCVGLESFTRDPIGFEGSEWDLYEYCESTPLGYTDPFGLRGDGHHIIPWSVFDGKVSAEVQAIFDGAGGRMAHPCYTNHNGKILNGVGHPTYTSAVQQEFLNFLNGKDPALMTPAEAERFLAHIRNMPPNSAIGKFLIGVQKEIQEAIEKAAKLAAKSSALKCCKKIGATIAKKAGPGCAILFFCKDAHAGGVGHACNEAAWPVSQIWVNPQGFIDLLTCPDPDGMLGVLN